MCREDSSTPMLVDPSQETPPRAWGRPRMTPAPDQHSRNTPTCVGKTWCTPATQCAQWKHPHVRGEDCILPGPRPKSAETPPRAWGRQVFISAPELEMGNTPTCVGKTNGSISLYRAKGKHPHVRGEDSLTVRLRSPMTETPPRSWGRLFRGAVPIVDDRNTPTCVGKTL